MTTVIIHLHVLLFRGRLSLKFKRGPPLSYFRFVISVFIVLCFLQGTHVRAQDAFGDPGARTSSGGTGDLMPVNDKVDAGIVSLGASAQVVVLFRNDDAKPLTAGDISLYPSSNVSARVSENQCSLTPLDPGAVCAVALTVKALQVGKYRIEMLVRHDGRSKLLTATVAGIVESSDDTTVLTSDIDIVPGEIDFGDLTASRPLVRSVILRNTTSNMINIKDISIQAGAQSGLSLDADCPSLETGQACIATVTWTPIQKGPATGVLVVEHSGPTSISSAAIKGEYTPDTAKEADVFPDVVPGFGLLTSSLSEVDFGTGVETVSAITVSLVNVGDAPLTIRDIRLSNNKTGVEVLKGGCGIGTKLDPIEACPLTLSWEPVREGDILDDIQIRHNGVRGILVLPVRGTAKRAVNKDSKAIVLDSLGSFLGNVPPVYSSTLGAGEESDGKGGSAPKKVEVRGVLDGYTITSQGPRRAIISGPGGSRVVFDGEKTIIGGVVWKIGIRPDSVQFINGDQQVLLLFDKSLSSVNRVSGQSSAESDSESSSSESSGETEN